VAKIVQKTEKIHHVLQGVIRIACTRDGFVAEIENNQDFYKQKPLKIINSPKTRKKRGESKDSPLW
jgi:hypothetical protein